MWNWETTGRLIVIETQRGTMEGGADGVSMQVVDTQDMHPRGHQSHCWRSAADGPERLRPATDLLASWG